MIGNLLIHREYTNPFPAKLIIEKARVYIENWNKPHGSGNINPKNFSPYPKNPMLAKFFKEIGWVDELGSGVRNTFKYCELYNPNTFPAFIEDDIFKTIIPLEKGTESSEKSSEKGSEKSSEKILRLIKANERITIAGLAENIEISSRAVEKNIQNLKNEGLLERIGADRGGYWKVIEK